MTAKWMKPLFLLAALYDGVLGVAVVLFALPIFHLFGVEPPNHVGYVQFPALLLLIFAAMFFRIAGDPVRYRGLIPYGIALKVAYCGSVFWHQLSGGVPFMWVPWAWADLVFLVLFVVAYRQTGSAAASAQP
jgi:hypothetical protein